MVSQSIKMNFKHFMEISDFKKYSKEYVESGAVSEKTLTVEEVYKKYMDRLSRGE